MKRLAGLLVLVSMVLLSGSVLRAEDQKEEAKKAKAEAGEAKKADAKKPAAEKKANRQGKQASLADMKIKQMAALNLTEEQITQIKAIAAEFEPKLKKVPPEQAVEHITSDSRLAFPALAHKLHNDSDLKFCA